MVKPVTLIDGVQLTNAFATYYTGPTGATLTKILKITVCNTDAGGSHSFSISIGVAGAGKTLVISRSLAANETQDVPELVNQFIPAGAVLQMSADTGAEINVRASGVQLT